MANPCSNISKVEEGYLLEYGAEWSCRNDVSENVLAPFFGSKTKPSNSKNGGSTPRELVNFYQTKWCNTQKVVISMVTTERNPYLFTKSSS